MLMLWEMKTSYCACTCAKHRTKRMYLIRKLSHVTSYLINQLYINRYELDKSMWYKIMKHNLKMHLR